MKIYKLVTGIRLSYTTNRPGRLPVIAMIDKNRTIVDLVIKKIYIAASDKYGGGKNFNFDILPLWRGFQTFEKLRSSPYK